MQTVCIEVTSYNAMRKLCSRLNCCTTVVDCRGLRFASRLSEFHTATNISLAVLSLMPRYSGVPRSTCAAAMCCQCAAVVRCCGALLWCAAVVRCGGALRRCARHDSLVGACQIGRQLFGSGAPSDARVAKRRPAPRCRCRRRVLRSYRSYICQSRPARWPLTQAT